jgi:hypothetical protein
VPGAEEYPNSNIISQRKSNTKEDNCIDNEDLRDEVDKYDQEIQLKKNFL